MASSEDHPQLIAHRGYSERFPENTLSGLEAALNVGADYIEFDVQISADGVPMVIHDDELERTSGVKGKVSQTSSEELIKITAGEKNRFGDKFLNEHIPTLDDVLQLLKERPNAKACVEIKEEAIDIFGVDLVAQLVAPRLMPLVDRCVLISFNTSVLEAAKKIGMERIGWIIREWGNHSHQLAIKLKPDVLMCNYKKIPDVENALWQGEWRWGIYDVLTADVALLWVDRGVHYIETWDIGGMLSHKDFVAAIRR